MNEQEKFLNDLNEEPQDDILTRSITPEATTPENGEEPEEQEVAGEVSPRNRRERRLVDKLEAERASSIQLAERLKVIEDARSASEEKDYLKAVEKIYGNDSAEAQVATKLLKEAIIGARDEAKTLAIAEMRAERDAEKAEAVKAEQELDNILDEVEDTYKVSLTPAQEKGFVQLLQKMSPKDRNGTVIEFADPNAVWEVFKEKMAKGTDTRAKNIAARSMTTGVTPQASTLQTDSTARALQEMGII